MAVRKQLANLVRIALLDLSITPSAQENIFEQVRCLSLGLSNSGKEIKEKRYLTPEEQKVKEERALARSSIFLHNDGIGLSPVVALLDRERVLELLLQGYLQEKFLSATDIINHLKISHARVNAGPVYIAMRLLQSQGWAIKKETINREAEYILTPEGSAAMLFAPAYQSLMPFLEIAINIDQLLFEASSEEKEIILFRRMVNDCCDDWRGIFPQRQTDEDYQIALRVLEIHLDGLLIAPIMVALKDKGILDLLTSPKPQELTALPGNPEILLLSLRLLEKLRWVKIDRSSVRITPSGIHAASLAWSYGVPVSYMATFAQLEKLFFGNPQEIFTINEHGKETHVNRVMNVRASGAAHATYFTKINEIILEIFNQPFENQPKGVADTGCGNGAFLKHIYEIVEKYTWRGILMQADPVKYGLHLIGIDISEEALEETKSNLKELEQKPTTVLTVKGTINNPKEIAAELEEQGIDMNKLLHVRSFLDHNRSYEMPLNWNAARDRVSKSTGAFMTLEGDLISNRDLVQNLVEHFEKWAPYLKQGLVVLELHTIDPQVSAAHRGKTLAVPYDATHGFSCQYIVEEEIFRKAAEEAGLVSEEKYPTRYPDDPALVMVSIHKFVVVS